ncbi:MAG: cobyrinate a,c-diamide synthase [Gammaproteobacteria bacterium]|nr:cobyrinate a,c-diamide synthase [Gammaproteobacteria bacterium]
MPHLLFSAAHKSSGKTTITLGLCAALAHAGLRVQSFKKGPDYIDPMWLGRATDRPCYNLDFNTMSRPEISDFFARRSDQSDIALIEGNMGLFDSLDVEGSQSNAEMAKLLQAPVVLVLDVKGATRSIVPVIQGFQQFDPEMKLAGVILNKVAGKRHELRLREAIGYYCDIPVLGAIHRDPRLAIDERHLGLIPSNEAEAVNSKLDQVREIVASQVDLEALQRIAADVPAPQVKSAPVEAEEPGERVRIAIARDNVFGFYYPDDLEALQRNGAELVPFDALHAPALPEAIDGLLIGGGFPETQLKALEANTGLRESIREAIEAGLPTYAECGGLMYLSRSITWQGECAQMVGIVPGDCVMHEKPVGRGYARIVETGLGPWPQSQSGRRMQVHEFHYSSLENLPDNLQYAYKMERGYGIKDGRDGFIYKNLLANYVHLRDVQGNHWTRRFIDFVRACRGHTLPYAAPERTGDTTFLPPFM